MDVVDGFVEYEGDGVNYQKALLTYNEDEKQENEIAKANSKLMFSPKFIPVYPELLNILTPLEAILFGFIDFYKSSSSGRFYFTNEQLSSMLYCAEETVTRLIKGLEDKGFIKTSRKMKSNGGLIRFVNDILLISKLTKSQLQELTNCQLGNGQKVKVIYNSIKDNKIKENNINIYKEEKTFYGFVDSFIDIENPQIKYQIARGTGFWDGQYKEIDKLIKDGYSLDVIKTVLQYIKQDDFWSKQILSIKKLRSKDKNGVPYIVRMIEKIQQRKPKVLDFDN